MPEKHKRRKPNKSQRNRNKIKQEQNKINNVENQLNSESCSAVNENKQTLTTVEGSKPEIPIPLPDDATVKDVKHLKNTSDKDLSFDQDLNSNSTELLDLNTVDSSKLHVEQLVDTVSNDPQYVVESPDQSLKSKPKLNPCIKSKSLDNEEATKIVEVTEECGIQSDEESTLHLIDSSNVLVSDVESDIEWEKIDDIQEGVKISRDLTKPITTCDIPVTVTQSEQNRTLTPEEEESLRNCLQNLPFTNSTYDSSEVIVQTVQVVNHGVKHKLRKKASADDFIFHRLGPPRTLDVIDEEGSGESSKSSRRQSYLSEQKNNYSDLDDDVFEDTTKTNKFASKMNQNRFGRQIQQQCMLLDTKLKEPEISEARGNWSVSNVEKMTGAEVVYLTDTSSSTSSIYENSEDGDDGVETDASVRMITPTIEVTDTETLLKETFVPSQEVSLPNIPKVVDLPIGITHDNDSQPILNSHEIVVLSTDEIKTNLTVKDVDSDNNVNSTCNIINNTDLETQKSNDGYNLQMKVLKCELNDAINNLIKEVSSDSESSEKNGKEVLNRQDSSSSVGSSQCTAKYNPTYSSLNDVANIVHDDMSESLINTQQTTESNRTSHVNDVFECVTGIASQNKKGTLDEPSSLKDLCVQKVATFPYGDKILEELASVSKRLQNITIYTQNSHSKNKTNSIVSQINPEDQLKENMPYYPLPDVSSIEKVTLPSKDNDHNPPPVKPRNSSLKLAQDDNHWVGMPTEREPVYVCLSPSQKMLMEKTNTVITKEDASQLVDMHKKYVDRRGYNEYYDKEHRNESQRPENTPIVPFKSQTGSRLLALIRDPSVTDNINSMKSRNQLKILDQIESIDKKSHDMSFKKPEHYNSARNLTSNLKPVPPPRTRKFSSSIYESDESSDFTDSSFRSIRNERKSFHYSTGNLSKEIENDISSIQHMHRYYTDFRDQFKDQSAPRRPSLPKDLCDQQMEYIRRKEKEVEAEIRRLENEKLSFPIQKKQGPRAPLLSETEVFNEHITRTSSQSMLLKSDSELKLSALKSPKAPEKPDKGKLSAFSSSQEELLREKMYSEYVNQMAEREERRQHKVIKITNNSKPVTVSENPFSKSMPTLDFLDSKVNNRIEKEFIWRARERWNKLGIKDPETEDERDEKSKDVYKEPKVIEHKIKVIEGGEEKDVKKLPSHLQEFVRFTVKDTDEGKSSPAVWRPGAPTPPPAPVPAPVARSPGAPPPPPPPPVWTPGSAGPSPQTPRKAFKPVHFEETPPSRRKFGSSEQNGCTSGSESEGRLRTSHSAPATGLNSLGNSSSRLPRAQNPTVTLLQKAREGQLSRGSSYLQQERDSARLPRDRVSPPKGDPIHALRREYASEGEADKSDYERGGPRKMAHAHEKVEGIGPTTKDGMPVALRSEVKDQSKWYKKMYDTIHKNKYDDDYVTIRYKSRRGQPPQRVTTNKSQYAYFDPRSGYLSEPEGGLSRLGSSTWSDAYDSDVTNSPRRRTTSVQEERRHEEITSPYLPSNKYSTLASARASQEVYKNQPGKIENYVPGRSSVVDKEAKQWWDEVMDIFDGQISAQSTTSLPQASPKEKKDLTSAILSKSNMARALKESGYESDSTLVFRRRDDTEGPLSPAERRAAYRDLQAGGEPPLRGFRSPAPPRTESPRRYVESDVNIHYRCPVRHDPLPLVPERELARQQAEHMKRLYREQRRHKYLQENEIHPHDIEMFDASIKELQDMQNRRHQDNFTPSQKTIVPLNRYDEAERVAARALYAFNGQTQRELSFRKGDLIHVRRQIDANWYEGELHGRIGLFPYNYVELLKGDMAQSPKKPVAQEGKARAKFDFIAQTNLELPLKKGEVVVLTRRIDHNWWEGRNGNKTGIFPDSYVTILQEPSQNKPEIQSLAASDKPVASPAAHGLLNGAARRSMGAHSYLPQPNNPGLANAPPATQPLPGYTTKTAQPAMTPSERGYGPPTGAGVDLNNTEPLYVDTNAEAVPYRAMYKYRPQNPDELELNEGDTVYVLEKCDDGWYVGSSQRTGRFGTFPGNYVERI